MRLALLVARREYLAVLRSRGFLFATLGVPLLALALTAVVFEAVGGAFAASPASPARTAFVDEAGVISQGAAFTRHDSVDEARRDHDAELLDAWFLIPADYVRSGEIILHSRHEVSGALEDAIDDFLRQNLAYTAAGRLPPERLAQPVELRVRLPGRELGAGDVGSVFILQFLYALGFFIALQTTGGYLIAGLVEEKGSRVLEILVTSISPVQLLLGKIAGLGCVGLTQLGAWLAFALALRVLRPELPGLGTIQLPPDLLLITLAYFLLSYFLVASIFVGIGAISDSEQESRQLAGILTLMTALPFIAYAVLLGEPQGPVSVALTLFPLTAPLTAIIRLNMGVLPGWQLALSLLLLTLSLVAAVPLAARMFRWSLLLYGQRPTPRRLWRVLRNPAQGRRRR